MTNEEKVMKYLIEEIGLEPFQAAGLAGNIQRESLFNPNAVNPHSKAYGIAQWLGSRLDSLRQMYGPKPTLEQQLEFLKHELNTTHKNGFKKLKNSKTWMEAALNGLGYYEFSAGPDGARKAMEGSGQNYDASLKSGYLNAKGLYNKYARTPQTINDEVTGTRKMIFPKAFWESQIPLEGTPEQMTTVNRMANALAAPVRQPEVVLPDTVVEGRKKSPFAFSVQLPSILDMFNLLSPLNIMTQYFANILGLPKLNPITPLP